MGEVLTTASNSAAAHSFEATTSDEDRAVQSSAIALSCPQCLAALTASEGGLDCPKCQVHYPRENGIADLRRGRRDYYFNPVARAPMAEIIAEASAGKWARSIRRFMQEVRFNPDWMDNLAADGRYAWKLFLQLPPGAKVLDIGCGLGNLTRNVAPHVGEVCALDLTWERLQFARARFAKFNRDDRISLVAGGDGAHLPFADETFDCVLISGVLEWVADDSSLWSKANGKLDKIAAMLRAHFGETNPRRVQLRFLQEVRRVLKTYGQLFVGI
jgi:SAM-dependent methyltransferase